MKHRSIYKLENNPSSTHSSLAPAQLQTILSKPTRSTVRTRSQTKLAFPTQLPSTDHPEVQSTTSDHSDIFAIIESHNNSNDSQQQSSQEKSPKRIRVALMGGKTICPAVPNNPSPACSQPDSPGSRQPLRRVLSRVLSSGSSSSLFGIQAQTSTVQPSVLPSVDFQLSLPVPAPTPQLELINTNHLVNLFAASHPTKKTYGAQRTFKTDDIDLLLPSSPTSLKSPQSSSSCARLENAPKRFKTQGSYNELRKKWGVDQDDEPLLNQTELQSTLHQRSSGSSKRFTDELLYLIEGLSSASNHTPDLNLKRANAIEFIKKFKDESFLDQLRNNGLIEQFYNSFRSACAGDGDPILDHALLIFISAMCCSGQKFIEPVLRILPKDSSEVFSMQSDCLQVLATIATRSLSDQSCGATTTTTTTKCSRTSSRSRLQQPQLLTSQIQQVIQESVLNKYLSGSSSSTLLSLFSLARIAMFVPRPGLLPQRLIVQSGAFVSVISCLKVHSHHLNLHFKNSCLDHGLSRTQDEVEEILKHVGYCVDVIEACTVCYEEEALDLVDSFRDPLVSVFSHLIESGHILARCDHSKVSMQALDISIGCIRTMVNITNFSLVWGDQLSTSSVFEALFGFFQICRAVFEDLHHENHNQKNRKSGPKVDSNHTSSPHRCLKEIAEELNDKKLDLTHNVNRKETEKASVGQKNSKSLIQLSSQSTFNLPDKSRESLLEGSEGVDQIVFDLLCVTLSLLANLLEQSTHAKRILEEINLPTHALKKTKESDVSFSETHLQFNHLSDSAPASTTSGFEELIKLYVRPPCRHLTEKEIIRGSICVLINLFLLHGQQNNHINESTDDFMDEQECQTRSEAKIIHSFNTVFNQIGFDGFQDEILEEAEEEEGKEEKDLNEGRDELEKAGAQEAEGRSNKTMNGLFKGKNLMVMKFIEDLKLHSSLGSSHIRNNPQADHPIIGNNFPGHLPGTTADTDHQPLNPKSLDLKSALQPSWDRLRVGLI